MTTAAGKADLLLLTSMVLELNGESFLALLHWRAQSLHSTTVVSLQNPAGCNSRAHARARAQCAMLLRKGESPIFAPVLQGVNLFGKRVFKILYSPQFFM